MQKTGHVKRILSCLLAVCLLALLAAPALAAGSGSGEAERRTVRVAFPEQPGMSYVGHTGKITGYNYDYLEKISEYTGWDMEYVIYADEDGNRAITRAMDDLEAGKVDLLGPMLKTEQAAERFEYPQSSYGTVYTTLCALRTSDLREISLRDCQCLRVGLWHQAETRNAEVISYLDTEHIRYEIFYYETSDEQKQALMDGAVDVISGVSLSPEANTRIVVKFAARPYYFISTKGNTELISELDETVAAINRAQPKLQDRLFDEYFLDAEDDFLLTDAQREAVATITSLRVLCVDNDAPYVYRSGGEPRGLIVSVLSALADELGIPIDYTFCASRAEANELLDGGAEYDILIGMPFTPGYCAERGFIKSEPIMSSGLAYASRSGGAENGCVAVVSGLEELIDTSAFTDVLLCNDAAECIRAVDDGRADIVAGDRSVLEYYIYDTHSALTTSLISGGAQSVCVAVSRARRDDLLGVLNSYLSCLPDMTKTVYLSDANTHSDSQTLAHYIALHPLQATTVVVVLTALLAAAVCMLLYSKKISRKNQELHEANEAKSEFLSRMSHDIRTPMNGIVGMADIAARHADDPSAVRLYLGKIHTASEYLLSLLSDVLDMRKLETEPVELAEDPAELRPLVESCVYILENKAAERGVTFDVAGLSDFDPPRVITSEQHLRRVLMNIMSNAVKFSRPGGAIRLNARVASQTDSTVTCEISVADSGIGMSEEFQKHMFEPFTQERGGTRSEYQGSGLGLSIVKAICDKMGAELTVRSRLGEGTTMTIVQTFAVDRAERPELRPEEPDGAALAGLHILAAEDNSLNAEILQLMLEEAGAHVTIAGDGQALVDAFAASAPGGFDLILTDIMMPVMDGYEAARAIRAIDRPDAAEIPIIALTANAFAEDAEKTASAGMNAHLTKPIEVEKLATAVRNLLKRDQPR